LASLVQKAWPKLLCRRPALDQKQGRSSQVPYSADLREPRKVQPTHSHSFPPAGCLVTCSRQVWFLPAYSPTSSWLADAMLVAYPLLPAVWTLPALRSASWERHPRPPTLPQPATLSFAAVAERSLPCTGPVAFPCAGPRKPYHSPGPWEPGPLYRCPHRRTFHLS